MRPTGNGARCAAFGAAFGAGVCAIDAGVAAFGAGVTAFGAGVAPFGAGVADLGAPFFFVIATRLTKRRKQEQWVVPESLLSK